MHQSVRDHWLEFNKPLEGRVPFMYLDVKGFVSTGVGNLIDTTPRTLSAPTDAERSASHAVARGLNWLTADGSVATAAQVDAEWDLVKTRMDYQVATNWGLESPAPEVPADHFSVRWQGWLIPPRKGKYSLYVHADDGARLFMDNKLVKDVWTTAGRHVVEVTLSDRPYRLRVEYREGTGHAMMIFGYVDGGTDRPIPAEWLFHDEKQEKLLVK